MWQTLRPQIKTLLDSLGTLVEVSKAPKIRFSGYPSAHVIPSDNTGDYDTNIENVRTYSFIIRVFCETKDGGIETAFEDMEGVIDSIIDAFDKEDLKDSATRTVGINTPAAYTFINVFASPGKWGEFPDEELVMAEITVKVRFTVDIS